MMVKYEGDDDDNDDDDDDKVSDDIQKDLHHQLV